MKEIDWKVYVDSRFESQDQAVKAALAAQKEGTAAALASADKAVDKAEASAEKWRNSANEWRSAMSDRERDFLSRKEFYTMLATAITIAGFVLALIKL